MKKWLMIGFALLLFILPWQNDDCARAAAPVGPIPVTGIVVTVQTGDPSVVVEETLQLVATVTPADATDPSVDWSVSDPLLASIDQQGLLTGKQPGTVTVTATARDASGVSGRLEVEIEPILVEEITLSREEKALAFGARIQLTARVLPGDATDPTVIWLSDDEHVATVSPIDDHSAWVTAGGAPGTARITASAIDGSFVSAECVIRVKTPVSDILAATEGGIDTLLRGASVALIAEALPSDASDEISWVSSNEQIALIAVGADGRARVTGVGGGPVMLTAAAEDGSGQFSQVPLFVRVPIQGVTLNETMPLFVGRTAVLSPVFDPPETTDRTLRWESEDASVATVVGNGSLRGLSVGVTRITARSSVDSNLVAECLVQVTKPVTTILLRAERAVLGVGGTLRVDATVSPMDAGDRSLTWRSTNPAVATVDEQGQVTGVAPGVAVIQATAADGSGVVGVMSIEVRGTLESIGLPKEISLLPDEQYQLTLSISPLGLAPGAITWTTSDASVATVDANGRVTGVAVGEAVISAACGTLRAQCAVKVSLTLSSINLSCAKGLIVPGAVLEMSAGEVQPLSAAAWPAGIDVTWSFASDKPKTASVSASGVLSALKPGDVTVTVTARTLDGTRQVSRKLTVKVVAPVTAVILPEQVNVLAGRKASVKAVLTPSGVTYPQLTWATGDQSIATVDKGVVTGVAPGSTILTATSHNYLVGVSRINVGQAVTQVELTRIDHADAINPGDRIALRAEVLPADASRTVRWSSNNTKVARVTQAGVVQAIKPGSARITAMALDGSGAKGTISIKVVAAVKKLTLHRDSVTLYVNGTTKKLPVTFKMKAKITPTAAKGRTVRWTSADGAVVSVSATGQLTARGNGVAVVTAETENDKRASVVVWVKTLPSYISMPQALMLEVAEQAALSPMVTFDGTENALTWASSKKAVVRVTKAGLATGLKPGVARVTATTRNGLKAVCVVTVVPRAAVDEGHGTEVPEAEAVLEDGAESLTGAPDEEREAVEAEPDPPT